MSVTYETYISGSCNWRREECDVNRRDEAPVKPAQGKPEAKAARTRKREKRTITEIRESKKTGEKMVYMSVPDYTSAQWAEMGGVDVAVLGDSLAMISHGHRNTVPATMDMMVMHGAGGAARRAEHLRARLHAVPELQHGRPRARSTPRASCRNRCADAVKPQGGKSQAHILKALVDAGIPTASHIGLTPHTIAMFGGFKIQGRTADAAMKILEDALAIEDAGCFMLGIRGGAGQDRQADFRAAHDSDHRHRRRRRDRRANLALLRPARRVHRLQAEIHQALRQADRSRGRPASSNT